MSTKPSDTGEAIRAIGCMGSLVGSAACILWRIDHGWQVVPAGIAGLFLGYVVTGLAMVFIEAVFDR